MKKILQFIGVLGALSLGNLNAQVTVSGPIISYPTVADAFAAINAGTHTGAITVDISASTTETTTAILNSSGFGGANYTSVLIFPSVDGVTINSSTTTATGRGVIELNGADNVTIDGDNPNTAGINKNLTIVNNNSNTTSFTSVIRVATTNTAPFDNANNITVKNLILNGSAVGRNVAGNTAVGGSQNATWCVVVGPNGGATPTALASISTAMAAATTVDNFMVSNCTINQAARGIAFLGTTAASSNSVTITNNTIGSSATLTGNVPFTTPVTSIYTKGIVLQGITGLNVSGNIVQNIISYVINTAASGIELTSAIGSNGVSVKNNTITGVALNGTAASSAQFVCGINNSSTAGTYTISNNIISNIQGSSASGTNKPNGIYVITAATSGLIEKNQITKVYNMNTGTYGCAGLFLDGGNNVTVQNNFISDINRDMSGALAFNPQFAPIGIYINSGTGHKIYHNSVHLFGVMPGTSSSAHLTAALAILNTTSTGLDVRNNIFANYISGGTTSIAHIALYLPAGATSAMSLTLNNNAYYSGTTAASQGIAQAGLTAGTGFYLASNFNASAITPANNLRAYTSTLGTSTNDDKGLGLTSANPFISNTNLHINNAAISVLESSGSNAIGLTVDIDNDSRPGPVGSVNGGGTAPDMGADEFDGFPVPNCAGAPAASNAVANNTLVCIGGNVNLSLSTTYTLPGIAFQWQSATSLAGPYSNITGATAAVYTATNVTSATFYQAVITCTNGPASTTSTPVQVTILGAPLYASVPFLEAFDNAWQNRCDVNNVPVTANWASNPTTGNNSWRRQNDGASANWTSPTTSTVAPMGTGCADFHSYYAPNKAKGDLDVYLNMGGPGNYEMYFYRYNTSGTDSLEVYLSTNGGATFIKKAGYNIATSWTKETINFGAVNSSSCVVRFRGISDYGANDIGLDSVKVYPAVCATPPVAGTITGTNSLNVLSSGSYTISPFVGNIQWYTTTSPTSTVLTSISGATNSPINYTATSTGTVYLTVIASNAGCPNDTSNVPFQITVNPLVGDMACNAVPLTVGPTSVYHKLIGYGIQTNEVAAPSGTCASNNSWCNNTLNNTKWFSFVAPASGNVSVQSPGFDTQLAVWSATNCSMLTSITSSATLVAANDDDAQYTAHNGANYSSYLRALCLTPGTTYYIQLDSYSAASTNDSTKVEIINLGANSFTTLASNYCIPSAANVTLTPNITGGAFTVNTNTTVVTAFSPTASGVGTHTVYYNAFGCISSSVTTVNNTPTVTAVPSVTAVCVGGSVSITASGANTYSWNTTSTSTTIVDSPTSNTSYTVTGVNGACAASTVTSVVVNALPVVGITGNTAVCVGNSAVLTGTGATTYSWNTTATTNTISVSPSAATNYTVSGTDGNNCSNTATFAVAVNANPTVSVPNGTICSGSSFTLNPSGATSYTYSTGPVVTPAANSSYTVTGANSAGCTNSTVATVSVNATPTVNATSSATLICNGSSAILTATGASTYSWNTTATTASISISPTVTTSYTVTGTTNGCSNTFVVSQAVSGCVGIDTKSAIVSGILVYPNPNTGEFTIELNNGSVKTIDVMDLTGRVVVSNTSSSDKVDFNINTLANGVYYVRIQSNNTVEVIKIVKQ